jgi:hypothetical protein
MMNNFDPKQLTINDSPVILLVLASSILALVLGIAAVVIEWIFSNQSSDVSSDIQQEYIAS